jgi:heptosyltransferase-2
LNRILVVRGGAIGDFILTLPALKALREAYPHAHVEILGYKHIAALADNRFYAHAVRSIESGLLASFFARNGELPPELAHYFASFDLIVSYLYDPDQIFENNLRRGGVKSFLRGPGKIDNHSPAARQLAEPLLEIGIKVDDLTERIFPSAQDRQFAQEFLRDCSRPIVALHPGSGSATKNWPIENWIHLGNDWLTRSGGFTAAESSRWRSGERRSLVVVSGEADETPRAKLEQEWKDQQVRFARNLPLPHLAAVLEKSIFIGHDSGISHLAAAAGADCTLLFGPTDPAVWAPLNANAHVIRAESGRMKDVDLASVHAALDQELMRIGMRT